MIGPSDLPGGWGERAGPPTIYWPLGNRARDAGLPVPHLLQRHDLSPDRPRGGPAARTARPRGRIPRGADLLRADALQHRLPARGAPAGPALPRRLRYVLATRAEYCVASDNSCLMQIGGALHRQRAGVGTVHLAEILATTEGG